MNKAHLGFLLVAVLVALALWGFRPDGDHCNDFADRIGVRLRALVEQPTMVRSNRNIEPPSATSGTPIPSTSLPIVTVTASGRLTFDGISVSLSELRNAFDRVERNFSLLHPNDEPLRQFYLWADRRTPVATVLAIQQASEREGQLLILDAQQTPMPPCPPELSPVCGSSRRDASAARSALQNVIREASADCPALAHAFDASASLSWSARKDALARSLPEALRTCGCNVEQGAYEYALAHMFGGEDESVFHAPLHGLESAPGGQSIEGWVAAQRP